MISTGPAPEGTSLKSVLGAVLAEVLEEFAFFLVDPCTLAEAREAGGAFVELHLSYQGGQSGHFALFVPRALLPDVAANILGCDRDDALVTEAGDDAPKELLNIMGAHVLSRVFGDERGVTIGVPTVCADRDAPLAGLDPEGAACVKADGQPVVLVMETPPTRVLHADVLE